MKTIKIYTLLFLFATIAWSCGDSDPDPVAEEEDIFGFGLLNQENLIDGINFVATPEAMASSTDQCASLTNTLVFASNAYLIYQAFFFPAITDQKSNQPIEQQPGHSNYRVYEWSFDAQTGLAIQLSESGSNNYFIVFSKESGSAYTKFIQAQENKNGKNGIMEILDDDSGVVTVRYTWYLNEDGSREIITEEPDNSEFRIFVKNYPDLSGELEYSQENENTKSVIWDADGNGEWQEYDENGTLVDEGSWTVN